MNFILDAVIVSLLAVLVWQDWRERKISWVVVVLLFVLFFFSITVALGIKTASKTFFINIAFLFAQLLLTSLLIMLKNRKTTGIINSYIGIGDVLLLIVLCAAFSSVNFILFYLASLFITAIGFVIYKLTRNPSRNDIPLAGAISLVLILFYFYKYFHPSFNFYDDNMMTTIITKWTNLIT